ncbi:MAG: hypothetical protein IIU51_04670 [Bacteroidaceae bacterium]|nr:hypothetical protein [Bacteroidaceae bacterium]
MDKLTKDFMKFEGVLVLILVALICLLFVGCTKTEYITVEKVRNDTTYINKVQRDSVWLHDSTFVKVAGDTVRIEKWHTKYVETEKHDTVYKARTDSVPVPYPVIKEIEKPRSKFEKGLMGVGILSIMALVIFIAFKLKRFLP